MRLSSLFNMMILFNFVNISFCIFFNSVMIRGSLSCILAPSKYKRISQTMRIKYKEVSLLLGLYFSNIVFLLLVDRVLESDQILRIRISRFCGWNPKSTKLKCHQKYFFSSIVKLKCGKINFLDLNAKLKCCRKHF